MPNSILDCSKCHELVFALEQCAKLFSELCQSPTCKPIFKKIDVLQTLSYCLQAQPYNNVLMDSLREAIKQTQASNEISVLIQQLVPSVECDKKMVDILSKVATLSLVPENVNAAFQNKGVRKVVTYLSECVGKQSSLHSAALYHGCQFLFRCVTDELKVYKLLKRGVVQLLISILSQHANDGKVVECAVYVLAKICGTRKENGTYVCECGAIEACLLVLIAHPDSKIVANSALTVFEVVTPTVRILVKDKEKSRRLQEKLQDDSVESGLVNHMMAAFNSGLVSVLLSLLRLHYTYPEVFRKILSILETTALLPGAIEELKELNAVEEIQSNVKKFVEAEILKDVIANGSRNYAGERAIKECADRLIASISKAKLTPKKEDKRRGLEVGESEHDPSQPWVCLACTYSNRPLTNLCDLCNTLRNTLPTDPSSPDTNSSSSSKQPGLDWKHRSTPNKGVSPSITGLPDSPDIPAYIISSPSRIMDGSSAKPLQSSSSSSSSSSTSATTTHFGISRPMPNEINVVPNHFSETKGSFLISTTPPIAGFSSRSPYHASNHPRHMQTASQGGFPFYMYNSYPSLQGSETSSPVPRIHLTDCMPFLDWRKKPSSSSPNLPPNPSSQLERTEVPPQQDRSLPMDASPSLNVSSPSLPAHIVESPVVSSPPVKAVPISSPLKVSPMDSPTTPFVLTYTETPVSRPSVEDDSEESIRKRRAEEEAFRRKRDSDARVQLREEKENKDKSKEVNQQIVTSKPRGSIAATTTPTETTRRSHDEAEDKENVAPKVNLKPPSKEDEAIRKQKEEVQRKKKEAEEEIRKSKAKANYVDPALPAKWELDTEAEAERKERLEKIRIEKEKLQQERDRLEREAASKEKQERDYLTGLLSRTPAPDVTFRPGVREIPRTRTKGLRKSAREIFETSTYEDNMKSLNRTD